MKYNIGDIVTAKLTEVDASQLNNGAHAFFKNEDIISRTPAPFDMANAKTGMCWFHGPDNRDNKMDCYYYVGQSPVAAGMYLFVNAFNMVDQHDAEYVSTMNRDTEKDKVMI